MRSDTGRAGASRRFALPLLAVVLAGSMATALGATRAAGAGEAPVDAVGSLAASAAIERGRTIVGLGNGREGSACAACHGFDGNGDPSGAFPRLAGQSAIYLKKSLDRFASGKRANPLMGPISKDLSDVDRADVAAYYASLRSPVPPSRPLEAPVLARGAALADVGSNEAQIPACSTCHGPFGRSVMAELPSLAGQYEGYIVHELKLFRDKRRGPPKGFMHGLASAMSEDEMRAVAAYFQRQSPTGGEAMR